MIVCTELVSTRKRRMSASSGFMVMQTDTLLALVDSTGISRKFQYSTYTPRTFTTRNLYFRHYAIHRVNQLSSFGELGAKIALSHF